MAAGSIFLAARRSSQRSSTVRSRRAASSWSRRFIGWPSSLAGVFSARRWLCPRDRWGRAVLVPFSDSRRGASIGPDVAVRVPSGADAACDCGAGLEFDLFEDPGLTLGVLGCGLLLLGFGAAHAHPEFGQFAGVFAANDVYLDFDAHGDFFFVIFLGCDGVLEVRFQDFVRF